jgi:hypothetical protein
VTGLLADMYRHGIPALDDARREHLADIVMSLDKRQLVTVDYFSLRISCGPYCSVTDRHSGTELKLGLVALTKG